MLTLAVVGVLIGASPAGAAVNNGLIAFELPPDSAPSLETINPDGAGEAPIPRLPPDSANAAWSADGTQLAFSSPVDGRNQIWIVGVNTTKPPQRITNDPVAAIDPTWSPDGQKIAFASYQHNLPQIEVLDLSSHTLTQLTGDGAADQQPRWSPDGQLIAFASNRSGSFEIYTMAHDGSNQQPITTQPGDNTDPAWSPRGSQVAFTNTQNRARHIFVTGRSGGSPRQLTYGSGNEDKFPAWSPDGTTIAFTRNDGLWTVPAAGATTNQPATELTYPAVDPVWAPLAPPSTASVSGTVTATKPGATTTPIGGSSSLPVGTVVNATAGSVVIAFKPLTATPSAKPATARVTGAAVKILKRTRTQLTLRLKRPACGQASDSARAARRVGGGGRVRVRGGHMRILTNEVSAGSRQTVYLVTSSCRGTRVTVTEGLVAVTLRRGNHRTVLVHAGHSLFARA